ncbi:MAG: TonB-dependent receptor [Bacteroidales bacterium]
MNIYKSIWLLFFVFFQLVVLGQKFTISGYVRDKKSGEDLPSANVYVEELKKGTSTNNYGFFSLTLPKGNYTIKVSFIGYGDVIKKVILDKDIKINFVLSETVIQASEITVTGERTNKNVESIEMSSYKLPVETIKEIPSFMGEVDVLKSIQLLPGVQSSGEGNSGFYVRGGGPDQNLILLDNAIVYNAGHLFGFFSIFNADAIKDVNLIKGGAPANYGGRLSSVLDISMKEGNNQTYHVDGGIGVISSRLTVQGPIKKDTSSFLISGRRTYIDILTKPFIKGKMKGSGYYFYDLNAKINYRFSENNRLFLSGYFGRDVFSFKNSEDGFGAKFPWGNTTLSARWNHVFNQKLFQNLSATFSNYHFIFDAEQSDFEFKLYSGVKDYAISLDYTYLPSVLHTLKFGAQYTFHDFEPGSATARIGNTNFDTGKIIHYYANDMALYANDEFDISEKLKLSIGIRPTLFQHIGSFTRYLLDDKRQAKDTIQYKPFENIATYSNIEPRLSMRYSLNHSTSVKASYSQNYQYIQLASMSSATLPTDAWIPCTDQIKPQFAVQYAAGFFKNFKNDTYETSIELYYKTMKNLIDYKEGLTSDDNMGNNPDNNFTFGTGKSYGAEFFVKRRFGKLNGWVGYTLSKTTRLFPEINNGKEYPAKYDRRHDLSVVLTYDLNDIWNFGAVFVYATGDATTLPISRYFIEGRIVSEYGERNSFRLAPYHRADISVNYKFPNKGKKWNSSLNFSIYNVYNRMNPYFIYFDTKTDLENYSITTTAKQVSLFSILPSLTYNFNF